jgi:magnesium transporter
VIVGLTLLSVVIVGTVVGAVLPLLLKRAGFDPAVSSAPAIASLVDVCGILIYFNIARIFLMP